MSAAADPGSAVETIAISKSFGGVTAVRDLSLSIPRGGVTSIVGPNGSGKSTLINLLSGTLSLDGGIVVIGGRGLTVVRAHDNPSRSITRTFQEIRLFDQMSTLDNILVVLTERRVARALVERGRGARGERAREILERVGLWEKRRALAMDLSYGQRKLLEIGRALAMDVDTYLLDEPFAGLFPAMVEQVKAILARMRDERRTVVFVSHNMDIVRELTDHLIVLDSGELLAHGDADDVLGRPEVIEAYLGF